MGPTKVIPKDGALYEVKTGKLIQDALPSRKEQEEYASHHYIALPVVDKAGNPWSLDGQPVYCYQGTQYETVDDQKVRFVPMF